MRPDFASIVKRFKYVSPALNLAKYVSPDIAQLVERSTVEAADIEWSLVRFRVSGYCIPAYFVSAF